MPIRPFHGAALALSLALTAPAAAEIRFEGDARMGIRTTGSDRDGGGTRWEFTSRLRATVRAEFETDGGLTFGGQFRLDEAERAADPGQRRRMLQPSWPN